MIFLSFHLTVFTMEIEIFKLTHKNIDGRKNSKFGRWLDIGFYKNETKKLCRRYAASYSCLYSRYVAKNEGIDYVMNYGCEEVIKIALQERNMSELDWDKLYNGNFDLMLRFVRESKNSTGKSFGNLLNATSNKKKYGQIIQAMYGSGLRNKSEKDIIGVIENYRTVGPTVGLYEFLCVRCGGILFSSKNIILDLYECYSSSKSTPRMSRELLRCIKKLRERKHEIYKLADALDE